MRTHNLFNFIGLLVCSLTNAQNNQLLFPEDFKEISISTLNDEVLDHSLSSTLYEVKENCQRLSISKRPFKKPQTFWFVESQYGTLFGSNAGEWIGGLYSKPRNGEPVLIKNVNVKFLHATDINNVFLFEVNDISVESVFCKVYRDDKTNIIQTTKLDDIDDVPMNIFYDKNGILYVIGYRNVYVFKDSTLQPLLENDLPKNLQIVNFLKYEKDKFIIGIKGGVIELNSTSKEIHLFVEKDK